MTKTRAKPWPGVANKARTEAIMQAGEIKTTVQEAHRAIKERNYDLAHLLLSQIEKSAHIIQLELENAPTSEEEPEGSDGDV